MSYFYPETRSMIAGIDSSELEDYSTPAPAWLSHKQLPSYINETEISVATYLSLLESHENVMGSMSK